MANSSPNTASPPGLVIRSAVPADRPAIIWLMRQLWDESHPGMPDDPAIDATLIRYFKQVTNTESAHLLIALFNNSPAGMAVLTLRDNDQPALITDMFIDPSYRRRGYARTLITRMESLAASHQCQAIEIVVANHNEAAQGLYRSLDYEGHGTSLHKKL